MNKFFVIHYKKGTFSVQATIQNRQALRRLLHRLLLLVKHFSFRIALQTRNVVIRPADIQLSDDDVTLALPVSNQPCL